MLNQLFSPLEREKKSIPHHKHVRSESNPSSQSRPTHWGMSDAAAKLSGSRENRQHSISVPEPNSHALVISPTAFL